MKVFKEAHVKFQAARVGDVYMLHNSDVIVGGSQLSSSSKLEIVELTFHTHTHTRILSTQIQPYII